jgi:predicted metal-dependent phosphoesterase TrpH
MDLGEKTAKDASSIVVSLSQAKALLAQGMQAWDGHVHSWHSYDVFKHPMNSPAELYKKALERGMTFFTITDHDTMEAFRELEGLDGVIRGVEVSVEDPRLGFSVHIPTYMLDERMFVEMERLAGRTVGADGYGKHTHAGNIDRVVDFLQREGLLELYAYHAHSLWLERKDAKKPVTVDQRLDVTRRFRRAEYNAHRDEYENLLVLSFAEKEGLGVQAVTDTHRGAVAQAYTLAPGKNFEEFQRSIVERKGSIKPKHFSATSIYPEAFHLVDMAMRIGLINPHQSLSTGMESIDRICDYIVGGEYQNQSRLKRIGIAAIAYPLVMLGAPSVGYRVMYKPRRTQEIDMTRPQPRQAA